MIEGWSDPDRRDAALLHCLIDVHSTPEPRSSLTLRERQVLEALSRGMGNDGTADLLGIGVETVKTRTMHARWALRAKNTTHACCEALRRGLIQ